MKKSLALIGLLISVVVTGMTIYVFLASDIVGTSHYDVYAVVDNANGLLIDTEVRIAGIKVGRIKKMDLLTNRAQLTLEINGDITIGKDDILRRVPQGILGASFLQLELVGGEPLSEGGFITNIEDKSLIDKLSRDADGIASNLTNITGDIDDYLSTSDLFARIDAVVAVLEETLNNINKITAGLAQSSEINAQNIQVLIASIAGITSTIEQFIALDKANDTQELSDTLVAIKESLNNIQQISDSINNGEGTIGKLIHDDTLYKEATEAVQNVNAITNRAAGLYTNFDYRYEGLISETGTGYASRNHVNIRISPAESTRYYQIGITTGGPEKFEGTPNYTSTINTSNIKLNLELAQQFTPWLRVHGGLIENTGGVGVQFTPIKQLELGVDAFDFGGGNAGAMMRANAYVYPFFDPDDKKNPLKWIYIGGGVDDILGSYQQNYYFGVGLRIYDEFLYDSIRLIPLASAASAVSQQ